MQKIIVLVSIVFASFCSSVIAADTEGNTSALGIGNSNCSTFMTTYEHNPNSVDDDHEIGDEGVHHEAAYTSSEYIQWLQGYLSAYNHYKFDGENIAAKASIGGMLNFLYQRCSDTPDEKFHTIMPALLERIESR
ncbi:MAG: hypothetical protein ACKVHQ_08485 [Gammaproteobacteria bacterium]|jgi:hypothetical protein